MVDRTKVSRLKLRIADSALLNRVYVDDEELRNVALVGIDATAEVTTIKLVVYMEFGEEMEVEGYLVPKEIADLYGSPDEIARLKYQAGIYRALRDGKTRLSNGYGHTITGDALPVAPSEFLGGGD